MHSCSRYRPVVGLIALPVPSDPSCWSDRTGSIFRTTEEFDRIFPSWGRTQISPRDEIPHPGTGTYNLPWLRRAHLRDISSAGITCSGRARRQRRLLRGIGSLPAAGRQQ